MPEERLYTAVNELIDEIKDKSVLAIRLTKKIVNAATAPNFGDIFLCEPELLERILLSGEPEKRIKAFLRERNKLK